jgi:hypothetical protein
MHCKSPRCIRIANGSGLSLRLWLGKMWERFLWVDSLSIEQDDPVHQKRQIDIMDTIYASATLTIVAAAGNHADSGLPGVSIWTRDTLRQTITMQDMEVSNALPRLRDMIEVSVSNS